MGGQKLDVRHRGVKEETGANRVVCDIWFLLLLV